MDTKTTGLTRFAPGSFREIVSLSIPLMLSFLSTGLMIFIDRLILARYSTDAMNAAVAVGMLCNFFLFAVINVISIAEVFVGRANGSGKVQECGRPIWQMLWLSLATAAIYFPLALFGHHWLVNDALYQGHGGPYFSNLLLFGPVFAATAALSAYFIALGRVRLVTIVVALSCLINALIDIPFVFGIDGYLPAMGTKGAALATGFAQCVQCIVLGSIFLSRSHRLRYGTGQFTFRPRLLIEYLKVGIPSSVGHMIEIAGWAVVLLMLSYSGPEYLAVAAVGQTFFVLFMFVTEGLQKGVICSASNIIGAGNTDVIAQLVRSSGRFLLVLVGLLAIPFLVFPDQLTDLVLTHSNAVDIASIRPYCRLAFFCVWLYFLLDGTTWLLAGVLTAGCDTKWVMIINAFTSWLVCIIPQFVLIAWLGFSPIWHWILCVFYAMVNLTCFALRYRSGHWLARAAPSPS